MADTTPTLREAAQQALEALVHMTGVLNAAGWATGHADAAVKALRAAQAAEQAAEQAVIPPAFAHAASQQMAVTSEWCRGWDACRAHILSAAPAAEQAEPVAVPAGYALMRTPITEEMHVAAAKVLVRANGLDGTPQRMLDAMIAAAPPAPAAAPAGEPAACISRTQGRIYAQLLPAGRSLPLGTSLYPQQSAAMFQSAPARQEPLTESQVDDLIHSKHFDRSYKLHASDETCLRWYRLGLRDGERAHGIVAAPAEGGAA